MLGSRRDDHPATTGLSAQLDSRRPVQRGPLQRRRASRIARSPSSARARPRFTSTRCRESSAPVALGRLRTYFSCTSTDTATMHVGVELFNALGGAPANDDAATSLSVIAGATVIFGTGPRLGFRGCRRHNRGKLTEPANIGRWPHPPRGAACPRCGRLRSVAARPIGIIEWLSSEARASSGSRSSPPRASQTDSVSSRREWRCRAGSAARCA